MQILQNADGFFTRRTSSRGQIGAAFALVAMAITFAAFASITGIGATRISEPKTGVSIDLRFEDAPGGRIRVTDAALKAAPVFIVPGQDGFVRTAVRSLARERLAGGAGAEIPFRLGRTEDGRLWLRDLATGRILYLDAYGQQNARSFARLVGLEPRSEK